MSLCVCFCFSLQAVDFVYGNNNISQSPALQRYVKKFTQFYERCSLCVEICCCVDEQLNNGHKQFTSSLCIFVFYAVKRSKVFFVAKTKHQLFNKLYARPSHCAEICCSVDQQVENTSQTDHKQC